jgi:hypothetical protein
MAAMTITNLGLNLVRDALKFGTSPKILYFAVGTSSTAPSVSDTQLGAEVFRKPITSMVNGGLAGEVLINGYLSPAESIGTVIAEWGLFAGAATGAANSGTLVARGLYSHTHTNTESIQFQADSTGA